MALLRAVILFGFFTVTAAIMSILRENLLYLLMFMVIGVIAGLTEFIIANKPEKAQFFRRSSLIVLGSGLFILALIIGINFQFSQIFFDLYTGLITGALIQFIVARLLLPFIFGNIFCSRACWDGTVFEISEKFLPEKKSPAPKASSYRSVSAWIYLVFIVALSATLSLYFSIAPGTSIIRTVFILQNAAIILIGLILSSISTPRAYCRKLCPFITISGLISPFSIFKVSPVINNHCIECGKCSRQCPMGIDVESYIRNNRRIDHPDCVMCETCVAICPAECIMVSAG